MKLTIKILLLAAALSALSIPAPAEEEKKESFGAAPFPVIAFTPETSLLLGGGAVFYLKPDETGEPRKTDSISIVAFYTLKNQFQAALSGSIYLFQDNLLIRANAAGSKFPSEYYGIGADTSEAAKEKYTPVSFPAGTSLLFRLIPNLYAGVSYDSNYEKIISSSGGGVIDRRLAAGSKPSFSSGTGAAAVYDTRDNEMNPHTGIYSEAKILFYQHCFGSAADFTKGSIDVRSYIPFGATTLGLQMYSASVWGNVPFYYYPSLGGGSDALRGYLYERFIERRLVFSQIEYRFPVWSRLGMVLFMGAGEVESEYISFGEHLRAAGGVGFRLMIDKSQKINMRMDLSYNGKDAYGYVNIFEAF